jgi:ribosomal protein S18 acetylase RimI-like enzyme
MKNIQSILLYALLLSTSLLSCMEDKNEKRAIKSHSVFANASSDKDGIYPYCPIYQEELVKIALDNKWRLVSGATSTEEQAIYVCTTQIGIALYKEEGRDNQAKIYLKDGQLVGFITYWIKMGGLQIKSLETGPHYYIHHLAIDKKHRGKGYASALLEAALNDCKSKGACKITLDTSGNHEDLNRLYTKFGFGLTDRPNSLNRFSCSYALRLKPNLLQLKAQKLLKWIIRRK